MEIQKPTTFIKSISASQLYLSMTGLTFYSIDSSKLKSKSFYMKLIMFWAHIFLQLLIIVGLVLYQCINQENTENNMIDSFTNILAIVFMFVSLLKTLVIFYHQKRISKILNELHDLFPKSHDIQIKHNLITEATRMNKLMMYYGLSNIIVCTTNNVSPLVAWVISCFTGETFQKKIPHVLWYPFANKPGVFQLMYLIDFVATTFSTIGNGAIDILLCTIILHICMQFQILQYEIQCFEHEEMQKEKLFEYVRKHTQLSQLSEELDTCYSIPMLANFIYSTFMLCLSGFISMFANTLVTWFTYFFLFISTAMQLFILCWYGNGLFKNVSSSMIPTFITLSLNIFSRVLQLERQLTT